MQNFLSNPSKATYSFFEVHVFNLLVGLFLGIVGGIIFISVYHTVVLLIAYS
jgi:hypothetical protein